MKPAEASPPPLPGRVPPRDGRQALRSLAWLLALVVLAGFALKFELPVPPCPLRATTGVPCPFCGSTRAFSALARLDFFGAVQFNPLVSVAACGAGVVWLLGTVRGNKPAKPVRGWIASSSLWKWLLATALTANWLYLWLHQPR